MLEHLAKLASRSAQLRNAALTKQSSILGSVAGGAGRWALNNPGKALFGTLAVSGGASAMKGKYKQFKSGFDPAVQQVMMGQAPNPPGT